MTLVSPGIEVQVIDESFYLPAAPGTVPLIFVVSKANKTNAAGTGYAEGTLPSNAGKVYLLTSQRDIGNIFGDAFFQTDSSGNPIHGGEINEYGLQAAYSYLAVNNAAWAVRADIDTTQLLPRTTPPTAYPNDGTYWLDTLNSHWGIFQWNGEAASTTGGQKFTNVIPRLITDSTQVDQVTGAPLAAIGTIGQYALVAISTSLILYFKNYNGMWVEVGSSDWYNSWPAVKGTKSNPSIGIGDNFYINGIKITANATDIHSLKVAINNLTESHGVHADLSLNRLYLYTNGNTSTNVETVANGSHTVNPTKLIVANATGIIEGMTVADTNGHWYSLNRPANEPGTVVSVNSLTNTVTLSRPLGQDLTDVTVIFQDYYIETMATGFIGEDYITVEDIMGITVGNYVYGAGISTGARVTKVDADNSVVYLTSANGAVVNGQVAFSNPSANAIVLAEGSSGNIIKASATDSSVGIAAGTYYGPELNIQPHYSVPQFKSRDLFPRPSGSLWIKTTNVNLGAYVDVKRWSSTTTSWNRIHTPVYTSNQEAIGKLDLAGGGKNLATGTLYAQVNVSEEVQVDGSPSYVDFKIFRRTRPDPTLFVSKVIDDTTFPMGSEGITFTGYISGSTLHVTAITLGTMAAGQIITGLGVLPSTTITGQISGTTGGVGSYDITLSQTVGSLLSPLDLTATTYWKRIYSFSMCESHVGFTALGPDYLIQFTADASATDAALLAGVINSAGFANIEARVDSMNRLVIQHNTGGEIRIAEGVQSGVGQNEVTDALVQLGYTAYDVNTGTGTDSLYSVPAGDKAHKFVASNWEPLMYTASAQAPNKIPDTGTLWYNNQVDKVDIMIHNGHTWVGYLDDTSPYYSNNGADFLTDPAGPIVSASKPTTQSDGTTLRTGDIWIDTGDIENYPMIYLYDEYRLAWNLVDNTDHNSENGIIFGDARYNTAGANSDTAGLIADLLMSNYLDPDAPDPALYPKGMLLWNTRRSGFNVKKYEQNYIDTMGGSVNDRFNSESMEGYYPNRWVSASGEDEHFVAHMGRKAQRAMVVKALKALVNTNQEIRDDERRIFNLIACPGYTELISDMVNLNIDRKQTAFVIGDSPFRLPSDATSLVNYFTNAAVVSDNNEDGLITHDDYLGVYYPSGYTTDNFGNNIVVPGSHMALRTISLSDSVSYPWFAPAGLRRGIVNNATATGYIDAMTGEFKSIALNNGQRDLLYQQNINPITFLVGSGITVFGQKTRAPLASALDRINVVRLIVYLRSQLSILAKPYLFEPNDKTTRDSIKAAVESLMLELVGQRALYDYLVVCDTSNNTPSRIDANELYIDIAIEPVKAIEFIYIPLRIKNTGAIAGLSSK